MCNPVAAFAVSAGVTAAGAGYSAYQQRQAGKADQNYYNYKAAVDEQNAIAATKAGEQRANIAQFKGSQDSAAYAREAGEFRATQRVALAANGIGAGSATAEDIATDTLNKQQLDEMAIRYNADMESWSAKTGAAYDAYDFRNQASLGRMAGVNARKAGNANAAASLIGGATSIASSAYQFSQYKNPVKIRG